MVLFPKISETESMAYMKGREAIHSLESRTLFARVSIFYRNPLEILLFKWRSRTHFGGVKCFSPEAITPTISNEFSSENMRILSNKLLLGLQLQFPLSS